MYPQDTYICCSSANLIEMGSVVFVWLNYRQAIGLLYKSFYINIRNIKLWGTQVIRAQDVLGLRPHSPLSLYSVFGLGSIYFCIYKWLFPFAMCKYKNVYFFNNITHNITFHVNLYVSPQFPHSENFFLVRKSLRLDLHCLSVSFLMQTF